jgi:hypothetical protein
MIDLRTARHVEEMSHRDAAMQRPGERRRVHLRRIVEGADDAPIERDPEQKGRDALRHRPTRQSHLGMTCETVVLEPDLAVSGDQETSHRP